MFKTLSHLIFITCQLTLLFFLVWRQGKWKTESLFNNPELIMWFGLPRWPSGKESACQCKRHEFDPWIGKIPWSGNGSPLQYSYLENPMDRGAWRATVHGVAKSQTQLSAHTHCVICPRSHRRNVWSQDSDPHSQTLESVRLLVTLVSKLGIIVVSTYKLWRLNERVS